MGGINMVLPGWKTFLFFAIMAGVAGFKQWAGIEIPAEIAEKLTEEEIRMVSDKGEYIVKWVLIVGGFFFRSITKTEVFKNE
jgi:hypothetical protein